MTQGQGLVTVSLAGISLFEGRLYSFHLPYLPSIMEETGQGSVSDTVENPAVPPVGKQSLQLDCSVFVDGGRPAAGVISRLDMWLLPCTVSLY